MSDDDAPRPRFVGVQGRDNRMRLIHVVPAVSEESSGPSYSVTRLCESLQALGVDVRLGALDWTGGPHDRAYLHEFPLGRGPRALGRSPGLRRWLRDAVDTGTVDIVHNHGMWQLNSLYPAWATRRGGARLVASPRGALSDWAMRSGSRAKRVFWPLLQRPALRRVDCFHATSEAEYADIRRLGFTQPVAIVPNGIDLPEASDAAAAPRERTVLFLGRLHAVKGLDMLLRAWARLELSFPDWRLDIAGADAGFHASSGYGQQLQDQASALGLSRVRFLGELRGADKWSAYRRASVYVLPSRSENFAVTVAEALSTGTPSVVTRGAPWAGLEAEQAGWWVDTSEDGIVAGLAAAMASAPEALAARGQRGRDWMAREFSWPGVAERMASVYRWIAAGAGDPPACVRID